MRAFVAIRRAGGRWEARVYSQGMRGSAELLARVTGRWPLIEAVAARAPAMLCEVDGVGLLVDFLRDNRCRVSVAAGVLYNRA